MHPDELPQHSDVPQPPAEPSMEDLHKVIARQHRVIELLKDQTSAILLTNIELVAALEATQAEGEQGQ